MQLFKLNKLLFSVKLNTVLFQEINKLNSFILQGFNVINISEESNYLIFSVIKPRFFINTDYIISNNKLGFTNHYSNSCGPFVAGKIENSTLVAVPGFVVTTHTSFYKNKYVKNNINKYINDEFIEFYNNNQFTSTLNPTDNIYIGSRAHQNKIFHPLNDTYSITFKTSSVRIGQQDEILKSNIILKDKFNLNNNLFFKGSDNKDYFFNNSLLSTYIKKNNVSADSCDLNMISKDESLSILLNTRDTSLEKIITGKDKLNIFKIKISLDEIKSSQPNKSIIELGSSGFAANESVNNAFEHSNTGIHKYFNSIN